jgi:hypothetical protein
MIRINRHLNLVIPVTLADGAQVFVHSTPISSDVFDTFFMPIAKTFAAIYSEGLGIVAGPRIADKMLRKVSQDLGVWEGSTGVQNGLIAEMHRLTNVLAAGKKGWEMWPFDEAKTKGLIDKDDAAEIEAALCFFTVTSAMHRKADLHEILGGAMKLWGAQIEPLSCTEYMNSLPMSTVGGSIGVMAAASSRIS